MNAPRIIVVGHCTGDSALIFCAADADGEAPFARLAWRAGSDAGVNDIRMTIAAPYAIGVHRLANLPAGANIEYAIALGSDEASLPAADNILARCSARAFRLLPNDRPLRVALVSCNGAYEIEDPARRYVMWPRLRALIAAGEVDLVVHAGDQVYSDPLLERCIPNLDDEGGAPPEALDSLIREFRKIYIEAWTVPEVADVLASCPSVMMWDDHDICDGWGSNDTDDTPSRLVIFDAARTAFAEFQMSHNPAALDAGSFAFAFVHNGHGFLLLDGRSHRLYKDGRILGPRQLQVAREWLASQPATLERLYLVLGVPPVHANSKLSSVFTHQAWLPVHKDFAADLRDGWMAPKNEPECEALMTMVFDFIDGHPATQVTILAGDVHVATVGRIERCDHAGEPGPAPWQVTSSGIGSPPPSGALAVMLGVVTRDPMTLAPGVTGRLLPVMEDGKDVLLRRNFAIVGPSGVSFHAEGLEAPLIIPLP